MTRGQITSRLYCKVIDDGQKTKEHTRPLSSVLQFFHRAANETPIKAAMGYSSLDIAIYTAQQPPRMGDFDHQDDVKLEVIG